jgi:hypothetical protein
VFAGKNDCDHFAVTIHDGRPHVQREAAILARGWSDGGGKRRFQQLMAGEKIAKFASRRCGCNCRDGEKCELQTARTGDLRVHRGLLLSDRNCPVKEERGGTLVTDFVTLRWSPAHYEPNLGRGEQSSALGSAVTPNAAADWWEQGLLLVSGELP